MPGERAFGDGSFLAHASLMPSELAGGNVRSKGRLVHQISMHPSIYFWPAPRDEWTHSDSSTNPPPLPCPPACAGSAVHFIPRTAGRRPELGTRTGACQCLCPTLPALCFPFWSRAWPAVEGTHTHTHTHMGWNIAASCLGRSQGGAGLAGRLLYGAYKWCTGFSLARTVLIVRT